MGTHGYSIPALIIGTQSQAKAPVHFGYASIKMACHELDPTCNYLGCVLWDAAVQGTCAKSLSIAPCMQLCGICIM